VVWQGSVGDRRPYADLVAQCRPNSRETNRSIQSPVSVEPFTHGAVRLIKNKQIEESRTELLIATRHGLKRGNVEAFGLIYSLGINSVASFVRQKSVKAIFQRLIDKGVSISKKKNFAGLIGAKE
jgi:hypothetical protein